jgi:membrane-associated protease RseP (regulator of RpoE activity)
LLGFREKIVICYNIGVEEENAKKVNSKAKKIFYIFLALLVVLFLILYFFPFSLEGENYNSKNTASVLDAILDKQEPKYKPLDKEDYDRRMLLLANNSIPKPVIKKVKDANGNLVEQVVDSPKITNIWPKKTEYPKDGAILPFNCIVAYYGNLYSKKMGILGEYPKDIMLAKLKAEVEAWTLADPETPAIPALHYIASVAQGSPMKDGTYRARMPDSEIEKVLKMAQEINAIVFIDIQVGLSNVERELPHFKKYLELPNVHLGLDPEFAMAKSGKRPGTVIGTMDAKEINFAVDYISNIVREKDLPPKILMVHRFTQNMLTNYQNIKTTPETQIVINMDGWGGKAHKITTYKRFVYPEPVEFTGFKIFYKNDTKEKGTSIFAPNELLKLNPIPIYIQYQ